IMVAAGRAATQGILFRDAAAIEAMCTVDTLVVDKTGTLTEGRPRFSKVVAAPPFTEEQVLQLAASLDQGSEHPLAMAIVAAARERHMALSPAENFASDSGIGVTGIVQGQQLVLGNSALMDVHGVDWQALADTSVQLRGDGTTVVMLAVEGRCAGLLAVADPIKATSRQALESLRAAGINVIMASGDNELTARAVG